jgi:hypothetical protein
MSRPATTTLTPLLAKSLQTVWLYVEKICASSNHIAGITQNSNIAAAGTAVGSSIGIVRNYLVLVIPCIYRLKYFDVLLCEFGASTWTLRSCRRTLNSGNDLYPSIVL